ncbi:hypothetical protein Droror1_Dr00007390 [Drosera rotundifolia]
MAIYKALIVSLLVSLLVLQLVESNETVDQVTGYNVSPSSTGARINCPVRCAARCRLSSRHKICLRACGTCCFRCNCVPPGTSGNAKVCPCYYNMTTHGGRRKCP